MRVVILSILILHRPLKVTKRVLSNNRVVRYLGQLNPKTRISVDDSFEKDSKEGDSKGERVMMLLILFTFRDDEGNQFFIHQNKLLVKQMSQRNRTLRSQGKTPPRTSTLSSSLIASPSKEMKPSTSLHPSPSTLTSPSYHFRTRYWK